MEIVSRAKNHVWKPRFAIGLGHAIFKNQTRIWKHVFSFWSSERWWAQLPPDSRLIEFMSHCFSLLFLFFFISSKCDYDFLIVRRAQGLFLERRFGILKNCCFGVLLCVSLIFVVLSLFVLALFMSFFYVCLFFYVFHAFNFFFTYNLSKTLFFLA